MEKEMIPLESSFVKGCHYDPDTKVLTLDLGGRLYEYKGVPESVYKGLLDAESAGKYFAAQVKPHYTL